MKVADLTPAERRVWRAFPRGGEVDFRPDGEVEPADGDDGDWGPARTVRADVLRALLLGGAPEPGQVAALRLVGARITARWS
jgi:hypothetical protein